VLPAGGAVSNSLAQLFLPEPGKRPRSARPRAQRRTAAKARRKLSAVPDSNPPSDAPEPDELVRPNRLPWRRPCPIRNGERPFVGSYTCILKGISWRRCIHR